MKKEKKHNIHWRRDLRAWSDTWDERMGQPTPSLYEAYKVEPKTRDSIKLPIASGQNMPIIDLAEGVRTGVFVSGNRAVVNLTPADSLSKSLRKQD